MGRPAPSDLSYGPSQAKTFVAFGADIDLTNQFPIVTVPPPVQDPPTAARSGEYFYAVEGLLVTSAAAGVLSVTMQANPDAVTGIVLLNLAAGTIFIRGAFIRINTVSTANITSVTAFWQGGPV